MPLSARIKRHLNTRSDKMDHINNLKISNGSPELKSLKISNESIVKKNPVLNF